MVPKYVSDVLRTLSAAQQAKFHELVAWAGGGAIHSSLPVNYDQILDMVKLMGAQPVTPIEPPKVIDYEFLERTKGKPV